LFSSSALPRAVLRTLYPAGMSPGQPLWVVCLVWLCASHVGALFGYCGAPEALGMLLAGVALRSLPGAPGGLAPLAGLKTAWSRDIRAGAMALVLLRAGLGLNLRTARSYGWAFVALVTLPSLTESLLGACVAMSLFRMPFLLAWAMGFMIAAVGPSVVSAGCAAVKERGYAPRAPNFIMTCMCFDGALCIIGFNCVLHGYLFSTVTSANAWGFLTGPLSLALGLTGGVLAAAVMSVTAVWCTPARRSAMLLLTCAALMYVANNVFEQTGAGAIANLTLGLCTRHAWQRGWPFPMLSGEHRADVPRAATSMLLDVQRHLSDVWQFALFPLLFGLLGASFDLRRGTEDPSVSYGRAVLYAVTTIALRGTITGTVTHRMRRFTRRERVFISLAWCTKATTQAAFATIPRHLIRVWIDALGPDDTLHGATVAQLRQWGEDIHISAVLAVFLGTPLGTGAWRTRAGGCVACVCGCACRLQQHLSDANVRSCVLQCVSIAGRSSCWRACARGGAPTRR
jgi:hypothetical protein